MKRSLVILLSICVLTLCGCEMVFEPQSQNVNPSAPTKVVDEMTAVIGDTVVYDKNDITVTITGLKDNKTLGFSIKSEAQDPIMFLVEKVAINGCMVYDDGSYSKYLTIGNTVLDSYDISGRKAYGINEIKTIDVTFCIYIGSDVETANAHLTTSLDDGKTFCPVFENALLCYKDENVEIYTIKKGKGLKDFELLFHNLTDYTISAYFTHMAVNGIMVDNLDSWGDGAFPNGWCYTGASNGAMLSIWSALEDEIKEKGFDNVSSITGSLGVWLHDKTSDKYLKQYDNNVKIYPSEL